MGKVVAMLLSQKGTDSTGFWDPKDASMKGARVPSRGSYAPSARMMKRGKVPPAQLDDQSQASTAAKHKIDQRREQLAHMKTMQGGAHGAPAGPQSFLHSNWSGGRKETRVNPEMRQATKRSQAVLGSVLMEQIECRDGEDMHELDSHGWTAPSGTMTLTRFSDSNSRRDANARSLGVGARHRRAMRSVQDASEWKRQEAQSRRKEVMLQHLQHRYM